MCERIVRPALVLLLAFGSSVAVKDSIRSFFSEDESFWGREHQATSSMPPNPPSQCPWSTTPPPNTTDDRVIGGEDAQPGEFPFFVGWYNTMTDGLFCGGTLIHEDIILTAAHCDPTLDGDRIEDTFLIIGAYFYNPNVADSDKILIEKAGSHPNYNTFTEENDVMVLKITVPSSLPTIALNDIFACPNDGDDLIAIGLGRTNPEEFSPPDILQKVTVPRIAHDECAAKYDGVFDGVAIVEEVMLCAGFDEGGKDTCSGDSGGPLLAFHDGEYVQVGITSFGVGCAQPNYPGVYTRVSGVKSWIDAQICELSDNPPASCG